MAILMVILLLLFEAIFMVSLFIIFASIYWIFIRALKMVFYRSISTMGNLPVSVGYAAGYTLLYMGWLFGIAYCVQYLQ